MKIIRVCDADKDIQLDISKIFVDGFYQWLKFFSKDKAKLSRAFAHIFNPEVFYIAVIDEDVAGMAACTDGKIPSVRLDKREFRRHFGLFMGSIAYKVLRKEFEEKQYPFPISDNMGAVEFVATSEKYRARGVATSIICHIHENTPYSRYVLEVADTNTNAVKLYEKLGYHEFKRVEEKHKKQSGLNFYVYMKYDKEGKI